MDYVREMEIWSSPGRQYQESLSGEMATSFLSDLKLSSDIFITLSSVPSEIDCQNLRTSFDEGELEIEDFETFCIESGVEFDAYNPLSACRFLEFNYGCQLAWIHLPESQTTESELILIAKWARRNELVLVEPRALYCFCAARSSDKA